MACLRPQISGQKGVKSVALKPQLQQNETNIHPSVHFSE